MSHNLIASVIGSNKIIGFSGNLHVFLHIVSCAIANCNKTWMYCTLFMHSGPRFVLNLIEGSFGGATLYENPSYVTPNAVSVGHFQITS